MTARGGCYYRPRAVLQRCLIGCVALALASASASIVRAQDEEERAGDARGEYAWGGPAEPEDPLRIMAYAGAGVGVRLLANLDPPFSQDFLAPAYVELGGAVFFPGAELRHGAGLNLATNVTSDGAGVGPAEQWALTPSYHLLIPLRRLMPDLTHDWLQIQARVGIPIVLTSPALGERDGVNVSVGGELAAAVHFKFLAGLGLYVEVQAGIYGGSTNTVHPMLAFDGGLLFDYEVLP